MKHDRKVGFINHSYSSSARKFCFRDSTDVSPLLHGELATPIMVIFMFLPERRFDTSISFRANYLTPEGKEEYSPIQN